MIIICLLIKVYQNQFYFKYKNVIFPISSAKRSITLLYRDIILIICLFSQETEYLKLLFF